MTALAIFNAMRVVIPEIAQKAEGFKPSKTYKNAIIFSSKDPEGILREYIFRFSDKDDWTLSTKKKGEN